MMHGHTNIKKYNKMIDVGTRNIVALRVTISVMKK